MKKIRICFALIYIIVAIIVTGEMYIYYASSFEDMTALEIDLEEIEQKKDVIQEIYMLAKEKDINICGISTKMSATYSVDKIIYCDQILKEYLENDYYIEDGIYNGLLMGSVQISYKDISEIPEEKLEKSASMVNFYCIGDDASIYSYVAELSKKYTVNPPYIDEYKSISSPIEMLTIIWGLVGVAIVILCYYQLELEKKEIIVKTTLGENINKIILTNILFEGVILLLFYASVFVFKFFTNSTFLINRISVIMFISFVISVIIQISVKFFNISEIMSNKKMSKKVIVITFLIKVISTIVVVVLVASEITNVSKYIDYSKQKPFFEMYKGYKYIQTRIEGYTGELIFVENNFEEMLYRNFIEENETVYIANDIHSTESGQTIIVANYNTWEYLKSEILELTDIELKEGIYVICKEDEVINDDVEEMIRFMASTVYDDNGSEIKFDYLKCVEDYDIVALNPDMLNHTNLYTNPIIVFVNIRNMEKLPLNESLRLGFTSRNVLYNINEDESGKLFELYDDEGYLYIDIIDVYESYNEKLLEYENITYLLMLIIGIFILINVLISRLFIQLICSANAIEISVKKIVGHNLLSRYKDFFISTILQTVITLFITAFMLEKMNNDVRTEEIGVVIIVAIGLQVLDFIVTNLFIIGHEKKSTNKILKGGCL